MGRYGQAGAVGIVQAQQMGQCGKAAKICLPVWKVGMWAGVVGKYAKVA